jgi:CRP-like cAMP-binding protein
MRNLTKKEYLLQAGEVSNHIYFIKSGLVRAFYLKKNKEVSTWFMKEGDVIFSVESFYSQTPSYYSIHCLEDSTVYYMTYEQLQSIYTNFIEFNVVRAVLTEKYYIKSVQRERAMRMHKALERFQFLIDNDIDLVRRVPKKYLASYLGVTVETLSRRRGKGKK